MTTPPAPSVPSGYTATPITVVAEGSVKSTTFVLPSKFINIQYLSNGTFGWVVSAEDSTKPVDSPDRNVAIKKSLYLFDSTDTHWQRRLKCAVREAMLLDYFRGVPGIVQLKEVIIPIDDPKSFTDVYFVMERYTADLTTAVNDGLISLDSTRRLYITRKILEALHVMHAQKIVHRDLKPDNILLRGDFTSNPPNFDVVICDLGGSRALPVAPGITHPSGVTTFTYSAPECSVVSLLANTATHCAAGDVWSVGCIHAAMIGPILFENLNTSTNHLRTVYLTVKTPTEAEIVKEFSALGAELEKHMSIFQKCAAMAQGRPMLEAFLGKHLATDDPNYDTESGLVTEMLQFLPSRRITPAMAITNLFYGELPQGVDPSRPPFQPPRCDQDNTTNISVEEAREIFWRLRNQK